MPPAAADELRPVTALFADIVGSTSLGERLSPGEVKALIGECVSRMSRAVEEFGGTIQAYTGDGICAYFGVPVAHENDPERAARAALRILEVAAEYGRDVEAAWGLPDFNVRVGINSGQTGVGMVGAAAPQAVALGDTTNVAARLESAAKPGTIAVGPGTAKRLAESFTFESLGEIQVKGRSDPVSAWRLVGLRVGGAGQPQTPLVDREHEISKLDEVIDDLTAGRGQILFLVGEAGIGKTRLLSELRARAGDRCAWLEGACVSYGRELASGPFVQVLRSWLGVDEQDPEVAVRMRLRAKLGGLLGTRLPEVLPSLSRMLSVRVEEDLREPPVGGADPLDAAYVAWVERLAASGPIVIAIDDLQWAEPSTRLLAEQLLPLTDRTSLLLVAAFRPDPSSEAWALRLRAMAEYSHRTVEVPIGPLPIEAARQLADLLLPSGVLDDATMAGLVTRAEGNPLYLEELLRSVVDRGRQDRGGSWTVSLREILPPSLESLFVARIDRLPPGARRLAHLAAVIGRRFPVRVLEHLAQSEHFQEDMGALLKADIVRELRRYPELECSFRHGLMHEAALSTLTSDTLRELNGQVAVAYEEIFAGALEEHLELLAYHYYRSDDPSRAMSYLERAADQAVQAGAISVAADLLRRARRVAGKTSDSTAGERIERRLAELGA
jgi:class 3 adenylate cyclase